MLKLRATVAKPRGIPPSHSSKSQNCQNLSLILFRTVCFFLLFIINLILLVKEKKISRFYLELNI